MISTDAPTDERFSPAEVDRRLRDPGGDLRADSGPAHDAGSDLRGCAGQPGTDVLPVSSSGRDRARGRFTQEHLMLMVAIGHQAGLAIENTRFYEAKLQAERLAAVGQTIATLSHHIKNILQGLARRQLPDRHGPEAEGRRDHSPGLVDRGEEPGQDLQPGDGHAVVLEGSRARARADGPESATLEDVVELMQSRAEELGVGADLGAVRPTCPRS